MKKIISLICIVAIAVACLTPVTFATATPTLDINIEKIEDFTGEYSSMATVHNNGFDIYLVDFKATGINLELAEDMFGQLEGTSIIGASMKVAVTSSGTKGTDWNIAKLYGMMSGQNKFMPGTTTYAIAMLGTDPLRPDSAGTITSSQKTDSLFKLAFCLKPTATATLEFQECAINVGEIVEGSLSGAATTYKQETSTLALSKTSQELPMTIPVTSVTISGATAGTVGTGVQLSATVLPDNATDNTVTWTKVSGNGAVSSTGLVTATAAGDVVVKATADGVDSANYTVTFAPADVVVTPTEAIKTTDADTTGLTDLKGNPVTLTKKYGIAKFSTDIDTVANNYFLDVEAEGGEKTSFAIDFDGIEISATTSFYAIVRSATRVISSIKLRAVAN